MGAAKMKKVYIIHGWTYNLDKWTKICKVLNNRGIEPVLLKVPGLTSPSNKVWDIDGYIEWLNDELKDVHHPTVIGHSNGGRIAMSYVQRYSGKIANLILIDSAGVSHYVKQSVRKLNTLKTLAKFGKPFNKVPGARKVFYKVIGARDYYDAPPNMRLTIRNMLSADQNINFNSIKLPVTIIWGEDDHITPLSDGKRIHLGIAGSMFEVIHDARHAPFWSHPELVADIIVKTVKGQNGNI